MPTDLYARIAMTALLCLLALAPAAQALTQADLRHRSIYQVLTDRFARSDGQNTPCDPSLREYCGGTWRGIATKLDYIQEMGFDTVWISPVVANIEEMTFDGGAYHGYWASDITRMNPHFGTPQDLLDLSNALHSRGMYLMVDVVANHVGAHSKEYFRPGPEYGPFDSPTDFHPFQIPTDWDDLQQSEQCWLSERMPDLNTENPHVINTLYRWIGDMVHMYRIDAIRIDTVKHVRKDFWPGFVAAGGVAAMGEVLHGDPTFLGPYQRQSVPSLLDYANYFALKRVFESTTPAVADLVNMIPRLQRAVQDPSQMGSFLDNHDFPRFAGVVSDQVLLRNAAVFPFVTDGFPIVYMGQEHGLRGGEDPHNREAIWNHGYSTNSPYFSFFKKLNHARRKAITAHPPYLKTLVKAHQLNTHTIALSKAPFLTILSNVGSRAPPVVLHITAEKTGYKPLMPVIDILSGHIVATDPKGALTIAIIAGEPRVFLPLAVYRSQGIVPKEIWLGGLKIDTDTMAAAGQANGVKSPSSAHRKTPSQGKGRMFGFFGGSKRSSKDLL